MSPGPAAIDRVGEAVAEQRRLPGIVEVDIKHPDRAVVVDGDVREAGVMRSVGDADRRPGRPLVRRARRIDLAEAAGVAIDVGDEDVAVVGSVAIQASLLRARATLPLARLPKLLVNRVLTAVAPWTETPVGPSADQFAPQSSDRMTLKCAFSKSLPLEPGKENGTLPSRVL